MQSASRRWAVSGAATAVVLSALVAVTWSVSAVGASTVAPPSAGTVEAVSINGNTGMVDEDDVATSDSPSLISSDGRYIAFCSRNSLDPDHPVSGTVHCYQRDRSAQTTKLVTFGLDGRPFTPGTEIAMTPDGRYFGYEDPYWPNVYRYDTYTGAVADVGDVSGSRFFSLSPSGALLSFRSVSANGRYALAVTQPIRIDLQTGEQLNYATGTDGTSASANSVETGVSVVSGDGRYVAFWSRDPGFFAASGTTCTAPTCFRLFRKDLETGQLSLVDVPNAGVPSRFDRWVSGVSISDDGSKVGFSADEVLTNAHVSYAPNAIGQIPSYGYVHDFTAGLTHLVSGSAYLPAAGEAVISGDGSTVLWASEYGGRYVTSSDADAAVHHLTALRVSPASQTWETGPTGAPIRLYATFDDGTQLLVPLYAWRPVLPWPSQTMGGTPGGDHFLITDSTPETVQSGVQLWDDTGAFAPFTITFAHPVVTITADDKTMSFDAVDPPYTYTVSGLRPGDTLLTQPTCGVSDPNHYVPGSYQITCQGAQARGYDITYQPGTLTVTDNRAITHTKLAASAAGVPYGRTPTFTATVTGSDGGSWVEFDENGAPVPGCAPGPMTRTFGAYQRKCYPNPMPEPGYHHITATYLGDSLSKPSSAALTKDVLVTAATKLVASPVTITDPNGLPAYRAVLTRSADAAPIAGMPVTFLLSTFYGSSSCTATTDSSGVATCQGARPRRSGGTYTAKFAARTGYGASTGKSTVKF